MPTNSNNMNTSQKGSIVQSSQVVAVYRFVILNSKLSKDDNPFQGIWISKDTSRKDYTYTARLVCKGWKATFGCAYSDAGVLETMEILDLNDSLKGAIDCEPSDKASEKVETGPSQEAQIEELGKKPSWSVTLDIPSKSQERIRDENGNDMLRFAITYYPLGVEDTHQIHVALCWAKKEVSGKPWVLSDAEFDRLKFDGKIQHLERWGTLAKPFKPCMTFQELAALGQDFGSV